MFIYKLTYRKQGVSRLIDVMCEGDASRVAASESKRTHGPVDYEYWEGSKTGEYITSCYYDVGVRNCNIQAVPIYFLPGDTYSRLEVHNVE